jgi:alpha-ketoglutarate-dependent taurine dioxygenase
MTNLKHVQPDDLEAVDGRRILLRVEPGAGKAVDWVHANAAELERLLQARGALLVRGLKIMSSREFGQVLAAAFGAELLNYTYRSTPRTELRGNVYTATEYHPGETIPQHNENAYANKWPLRIGFLCLIPPASGGATPIADSREVYELVPDDVRERFELKQVLYVRNYGEIDLPWSEVFQTEDRAEVERYCRENALEYEWRGNGRLRTKQVNAAVATHPLTGERLWFNQAHLFHLSALRDAVRESILAAVKEEDVPRHAYHGDGSPLAEDDLRRIRAAYAQATYWFEWQKHDLLLLDNMLYTHGRQPYQGERQVLVGMARPASARGLEADVAARVLAGH